MTKHERVLKMLADLSSAQATLGALNNDLLRATVAASDDVTPLQKLVEEQHERVMALTEELMEALRAE